MSFTATFPSIGYDQGKTVSHQMIKTKHFAAFLPHKFYNSVSESAGNAGMAFPSLNF
jgi:hypothetical protein